MCSTVCPRRCHSSRQTPSWPPCGSACPWRRSVRCRGGFYAPHGVSWHRSSAQRISLGSSSGRRNAQMGTILLPSGNSLSTDSSSGSPPQPAPGNPSPCFLSVGTSNGSSRQPSPRSCCGCRRSPPRTGLSHRRRSMPSALPWYPSVCVGGRGHRMKSLRTRTRAHDDERVASARA